MVAPGRFELPSPAPKASMIDHYTTGLFAIANSRSIRRSEVRSGMMRIREMIFQTWHVGRRVQ